MRARRAILGCAVALLATAPACVDEPAPRDAVDEGRALFADPSLSTSTSNVYSCATCHAAEGTDERLLPGAPLGGVVARATFWGGREDDLLAAVNRCRASFLETATPWTGSEPPARALYAYLAGLPTDGRPGVPFTVPPTAREPAGPADPAAGGEVYRRACQGCHGPLHTGAGRLAPLAPRLPDETLREHAGTYTPAETRLVFVEKVRHGPFFQYGGTMPPFSLEVLPDAELSSLLAYLGL